MMSQSKAEALEELARINPDIVPVKISYNVDAAFFAHQKGKKEIRGFTSGIILTPENQIVLARRGKWFMPGGGVETGETFSHAMEREIMEEVDIPVYDLSLVAVDEEEFIAPDGDKIFSILAVFAMKTKNTQLPPLTAGAKEEGIEEISLFEIGSLPEIMALTDREKILSYFKNSQPTW